VETLHFQEIANRPLRLPLALGSSVSMRPMPRRPCRPCAVHRPPPRRSKPCHVPPQHPHRRFPGPRWPAPASPCRAATARAATPPADLPTPAPAQPRLLLDPEHILELPTHSLLHLHTPILLTFLCPDHRTSPDLRRSLWSPSSAAHAASHPRSSAPRAPP
jgi:hypothetical protein